MAGLGESLYDEYRRAYDEARAALLAEEPRVPAEAPAYIPLSGCSYRKPALLGFEDAVRGRPPRGRIHLRRAFSGCAPA